MEKYSKSTNFINKHNRKEFTEFVINFRVNNKNILEKFEFNF